MNITASIGGAVSPNVMYRDLGVGGQFMVEEPSPNELPVDIGIGEPPQEKNPATTLADIFSTAEAALKNGSCAELFKDKDWIKNNLETFKGKTSLFSGKYNAEGISIDTKKREGLFGWYDPAKKQIFISKDSAAYTGVFTNFEGKSDRFYRASGIYAKITPAEFLAAIFIHELLHASGDFPLEPKDDPYANRNNNNKVFAACFLGQVRDVKPG